MVSRMLGEQKRQELEGLCPDVLVIGGGPAGTTLSTLLVEKGYSVTILEKSQHPRFHIGESLLPMNLPILERLGVGKKLATIGLKKMGADFTDDVVNDEYRTYRFDRALGDSPGYAYEVKRDEFDHMLFLNSQEKGVRTLENHSVVKVELDEKNGQHKVHSKNAQAEEFCWHPSMVIDASGRDAFVSSTHRWKKKSPAHASAAMFAHFKSAERRPDDNAGNISVYWFEHGWFWFIPLNDDLVSVGAVCWPEYFKNRGAAGVDTFLMKTIAMCEPLQSRLENSERVSPVRMAGNFSYSSKQLAGRGYMLVGDAYAFVDPVFSSGVYLAMSSAERALPVAAAWLERDEKEFSRQLRSFKKTTRRGLSEFSWFIHRFNSPAMRALFANPRNFCRVEQAVISMLCGDVFDNVQVRRRLLVFKALYGISWLLNLRCSLVFWKRRKLNVAGNFDIPAYSDNY